MSAVATVDAAIDGRLLVAGSLPPGGRDLDLLGHPADLAAAAAALEAEGFVRRGTTWASFDPLELVDLDVLADDRMLERATPLPGCDRIVVPDPADRLRLTATAYAADRLLTSSRRSRAEVSPEVWATARLRGDASALALLQQALAHDPGPGLPLRVAGRVRRMRTAGVVTLSGIDGSGKSTQAELLRDTLATTGFETVIEWNRLSHDRWLDAIARPVKRLLGRGGSGPSRPQESGGSAATVPRGGRTLWVVVVALANAVAHNRSIRRHLLAGRVVICDRYVLDSVVQLRSDYPAGLGNRLGTALVRWLSPRPVASFLLDLPPEVATARKPWWDEEERLVRHARGYQREAPRLGVVRLDATQPVPVVAAAIARETWRSL